MEVDKIIKTEFRGLSDRVAIHCKIYSEFEEVKKSLGLKFNESNVWSKYKQNTGVSVSFAILNGGVCVYPGFGNINGSYKKDGYKIIPASKVLEDGVSITDSGYNFLMAKALSDMDKRLKSIEMIILNAQNNSKED